METISSVLDDFEGIVMCDASTRARTAVAGPRRRRKLLALELRRKRRDLESRPLAGALKTWTEQQTALPRTALAEALGYLLNHWDTLTAFLDDPLIPLDNSWTERALRDLVLGRKNHYGCRWVRGVVGRLGAGGAVADPQRARSVPAGQPPRRQGGARAGTVERKRTCSSRARDH